MCFCRSLFEYLILVSFKYLHFHEGHHVNRVRFCTSGFDTHFSAIPLFNIPINNVCLLGLVFFFSKYIVQLKTVPCTFK